MESFTIRLKNLKFYSKIGVFEQERHVGNEFEVNISIKTNAEEFRPEILESSISYADIYDIADEEMKKEWLLLESVAQRIADKITSRYDSIIEIKVEIVKSVPPISGIQGNCSVEYCKVKN